MIARVIVSAPKGLLVDEAASTVDMQSEGVVQDALDKDSWYALQTSTDPLRIV